LELKYLIQRIVIIDDRKQMDVACEYKIASKEKLEDINDELALTNLKFLATKSLKKIQQIRKENKTMIWESTSYLEQRFRMRFGNTLLREIKTLTFETIAIRESTLELIN
jgi:hypothetical protein